MSSTALVPDFIEFHNTPAPEPSPAGLGWILPRYPRNAYTTFGSPGFLTAQESTGVELRFVTKARHLRVFVTALTQDSEVAVFKGDFLHHLQKIPQGPVQCIHLTPPDLYDSVRPEALRHRFDPEVWRVVFDRGTIVFNGIDSFGSPIRRPRADEKPALRWLAYGSSITHATWQGYPDRAARVLGLDVLNKGQSGSCYLDEAAARFIAEDCEWDIATLELGINLRDTCPPDEFERRARRLVSLCIAAKPGRPLVLITPFRNSADHLLVPSAATGKQQAFGASLRAIAAEHRAHSVHLVEGHAIVDSLGLLRSDLLHPTDHGLARMAENLARELAPILASLTPLNKEPR
jgi:lysophospholipase L1-like esterase